MITAYKEIPDRPAGLLLATSNGFMDWAGRRWLCTSLHHTENGCPVGSSILKLQRWNSNETPRFQVKYLQQPA